MILSQYDYTITIFYKINSGTTKIDNDKPVLKLVVESAQKSQSKLQEQRIRNFTTHTNLIHHRLRMYDKRAL